MNLRMGQEAGIMELSPLQGMGETHQVKKKWLNHLYCFYFFKAFPKDLHKELHNLFKREALGILFSPVFRKQ